MIGRGLILAIVCLLTADAALAADSPRRPRAPLWGSETEGWTAGSATSVKRNEAESPEPPVSLLSSPTTEGRYSYGTAYAAGPNGLWLTARHVVDHCRAIMVEGGSVLTQLLVIEINAHERADVALVRTTAMGLDVQPLPLASKSEATQEAFQVGFPQAKPAAFASRYIGNTRARRIGAHPSENDSKVWAITSETSAPNDLFALAGAPVLDATGRAVGVVVGESLRRGRLISTLPEAAWEVVQGVHAANIQPAAKGSGNITIATYPAVARELVTSRRVARVVCEEKRDVALPERRY